MKRLILILVVFLAIAVLPSALIAQQTGLSRMKEQPGPGASPLGDASSTGGLAEASMTSSASGISPSVAESQPDPQPPQTSKSTQSQKTAPAKEPSGPPLEGSMVGYVDDAIVGSQVRIRFDAGFKDNAPDRAEFFYPQCGCSLGGPGPRPGASNNINFQQLYFQGEFAPVRRFSVFTEVPIRWIQPQSFIPGTSNHVQGVVVPGASPFSNQSGISDVRAGFKLAATASSDHSLTFQFKAYFPSGDGSRGLGTAHYSVEPSLLYYQRLSERWAVESQIGGWIPINGSSLNNKKSSFNGDNYAGDIFFYGIGPSYKLVNRENIKFAPVVELFGWHVLGGLETVAGAPDASGTDIVNLKLGVRTSFGRHNSIYAGFGQAVTHSVWYEHIVRLEYRYSF